MADIDTTDDRRHDDHDLNELEKVHSEDEKAGGLETLSKADHHDVVEEDGEVHGLTPGGESTRRVCQRTASQC